MLTSDISIWPSFPLSAVCKVNTDTRTPSSIYVGIEHIIPNTNSLNGYGNIANFKTSRIFQSGNLLYAKLGPASNKIWLANHSGHCSTDIIPLSLISKLFVPKFLLYVLSHTRFIHHAISTSSGTIMPRTSWNNIKNFHIPAPPIQEQRRIASILANIDALIENVEETMSSYGKLKQGLMQQLFTVGVGHSQYQTVRVQFSKQSTIPKSWIIESLSSFGKIIGGGTPSTKNKEYWNGDVLWATPSDITELKSVFINNTKRTITEKGLKKSAAKLLPPHSILITTRATIGAMAINTRPMATNQGFHSICCNSHYVPSFIFYLIMHHNSKLLRYADGTTFLEVGKTDLEKIRIALPPKKAEQRKIASILSGVDAILENYCSYKNELEQLKQGLMQQLLTGKMRI